MAARGGVAAVVGRGCGHASGGGGGGGARSPTAAVELCANHPGEPMKLWCDTCSVVICRDCIVVDHRGHDYNFLPNKFKQHQSGMLTALLKRKSAVDVLEAAVTRLRAVESALQQREAELAVELDAKADALVAVVEQRRRKWKQECAQVMNAKAKRLVAQRDVLENALAAAKAVCSFAKDAIARGATDPVSTLRARAQLLRDLRLSPEQDLALYPCESDRLAWLETPVGLMADLATYGGVTGSATCAARCTAKGDGLVELRPDGDEAAVTVQAVDFEGVPRTEGGDVVTAVVYFGEGGASEGAGGGAGAGGSGSGARCVGRRREPPGCCPVCSEPMLAKVVHTLPCDHDVCAKCCRQWEAVLSAAAAQQQQQQQQQGDPCQCPVCRRKFAAGAYKMRWSRWAVADAGDGTYQCSYESAPDDGGTAMLEVRVAGALIQGSSFTVQCPDRKKILFSGAGSSVTLSGGGTVATKTGPTGWGNSVAVLGHKPVSMGVHAWEFVAGASPENTMVGVCKAIVDVASTNQVYSSNNGWFLYFHNGSLYGNGTSGSAPTGRINPGDHVGLRLDLSAGTLTFTKNGGPVGPGHTGVVGPVWPCVEMYDAGSTITVAR